MMDTIPLYKFYRHKYGDELPSPDNSSGRCGYIMNMYVRPGFRSEGIATDLLKRLIADAEENNCGKIYLETTDMGRCVYIGAGFREMKDMMKYESRESDIWQSDL